MFFQWGTVYYDILWYTMAALLHSIDDFSISYSICFCWGEFGGILHHPAIDRGWLLSFRADRDMSRPREIGSGFTPWKCGENPIPRGIPKFEHRETSWNVMKNVVKNVVKSLELFDKVIWTPSARTRHDTTCLVHVWCIWCRGPALRLPRLVTRDLQEARLKASLGALIFRLFKLI